MNSKTPETDLIMTGNSEPSPEEYEDLAGFCRQLERQRDALREATIKVRESKGRHHSEIAHRELYALLP